MFYVAFRLPSFSSSLIFFPLFSLFSPSAGTQSGEEIHIVSCSNIKEFKDSFSNEKYDFRSNVNITFFVYVSNFTWPIKIQVCISGRHPGDTGGFKLYIGVVSLWIQSDHIILE